jgi:hypothetical protein
MKGRELMKKQKLRRKVKRKTNQPNTKILNFGMGKVLTQIDQALTILANKR